MYMLCGRYCNIAWINTSLLDHLHVSLLTYNLQVLTVEVYICFQLHHQFLLPIYMKVMAGSKWLGINTHLVVYVAILTTVTQLLWNLYMYPSNCELTAMNLSISGASTTVNICCPNNYVSYNIASHTYRFDHMAGMLSCYNAVPYV